jgi:plasmid stabilization system protein ParE
VSYKVRLTRHAQGDLERLFDFILERELNRHGGGSLALADAALTAIHAGIQTLASSPFTCRKAGANPLLRELIISFGRSGYVALFEIDNATTVTVLAVRHQLEDDYL